MLYTNNSRNTDLLIRKGEDKCGLSPRDHNFHFNMIKGRLAESLIQELFLSRGYNVFPYGMENTIPGIMESLKGSKRTDVSNHIKSMPDFVIQEPKTKTV